MSRLPDIDALLLHSREAFGRIQERYAASLEDQRVSDDLRVEIKGFFENLRSALDYCAHEIRERFCKPLKSKERIYFPILPSDKDFERQMNQWFPKLQSAVPDLWEALETFQPYHDGYRWLGQFNLVNNQNKHDRLIEQTRITTRQVKVSSDHGPEASWNPDAVTFGSGVDIAGVPVDPATQLPIPHPSQKVERITWVDFRFEGIDISALELMNRALDGIAEITSTVYSIIEEQSAG
jgi:hypothetical protein